MIAHTVHAAGGVLEAARSYELFKYVNRICVLFEQAGVKDERLAFFKNWSELVYRVDREATGALDRPEGAKLAGGAGKASVRTDAGAPQVAPSDSFLLDNYQRFGEMVEQQGEALGKRAQAEAAGAGGGDAGGPARPPIGAPQLLRLPRPTEADGVHAPSPAAPSRVSGDGMALLARLTQAKQTLEQELEATKDFPAQNAAARRTLDEVLSKPMQELTPADLAVSSTLQSRLFQAAGGAVERMKALADRVLAGAKAEVISILKRPDLEGFVAGILEKCKRKGYQRIAQMDDIIRGRLNIEDGPAVAKTASAMRAQAEFPVKQVVEPRTTDTGVVRYPRYHIIVEDPQTGLTHEWQIGTKATSTLYETQGIIIPSELKEAAERLGKHFRADIHDIEYDVFQAFNAREPGAAAELGIPGFIAKVAEASQRSAAGSADTALTTDISTLHGEASRILKALVDKKGADYVAGMFH
jgi:hypothetical protein